MKLARLYHTVYSSARIDLRFFVGESIRRISFCIGTCIILAWPNSIRHSASHARTARCLKGFAVAVKWTTREKACAHIFASGCRL